MSRAPRGLGLVAVLLAAAAQAASLSLDRGPVVLGQTESVGVTLQVDEPAAGDPHPLRVAVNVGSFGSIARIAPGVYRSIYTPPSTRFPQVALIALWRETGPQSEISFVRLPLYGIAKIPLHARRGSEVRIEVGPDSFGPVVSTGARDQTLPISVPPGYAEATKFVREPSGAAGSKKMRIEVPPYNRLTTALVPSAITANGHDWARLDVFYDLVGLSASPSKLEIVPEVGTVTLLKTEAGRYVYRYQPPAGTVRKSVKLEVRVEGEPTAQATAELSLQLPPPEQVVVRPPAARLVADGRAEGEVRLLVLDRNGLGLAGQKISLRANGKEVTAPARDLGEGEYAVKITAPRIYPPGGIVELTATATGPGGSAQGSTRFQLEPPRAPKMVFASYSPSPVPLDGRTETKVVLDVRDAEGMPLQSAQLLLAASSGTLGDVEEDQPGLYHVRYLPPAAAPEGNVVLRLVDSGGFFEQSLEVPVREAPHHLLVGLRFGLEHSLGELFGPRVGLELLAPFRVGGRLVAVGLDGSVGRASQTVTDGTGELSSRSEATFAPVNLRVGLELFAARRLSFWAGAAASATFARFDTTLTGRRTQAVGFGGFGFGDLSYVAGPGEAFVELSLGTSPVNSADFQLEAGGVGLSVGYRLGVL